MVRRAKDVVRYLAEPLEPRRFLTHAVGNSFIISELSGLSVGADVAVDADGDFVAVWRAQPVAGVNNFEIRARLYDHFGTPRGNEFVVSTSDALNPHVAMDADGDFAVSWEGGLVRLYNSDGTPKGAAIDVSPDADTQETDVAMEDNGDFVVAWTTFPDSIVRARRYSASGTALANAFTVATTDGTQSDVVTDANVAMDADGDFVVIYKRGHQFGVKDVSGRRYTNAGAASGGEFIVSTPEEGANLYDASVSMSDAGAFVVAWTDEEFEDVVRARRYNSAGTAQGASFLVNTDAGGINADVAVDASGDFTIVWSDQGDEFITGRRYSSTGVAEGSEFDVDFFNPFRPDSPSVAAEADGSFVAVWGMFDGSRFRLWGRRWSSDETDPAAPATPNLIASSDRGRSNSDDVTNDAAPNFLGSAEPGSIVTLLVDGVEADTDVVSTSGAYIVAVPASFNLTDGVHSFRTRATDDGGNTGPLSGALSVTIDTSAPTASPAPDLAAGSDTGFSSTDNVTRDTTPLINGTGDSTSIIRVFDNGVDVTNASLAQIGTTWSITLSTLASGLHNLTFTEEDVAGNVSAPSPALAVTIDTAAPAGPTVAPALLSDPGASNTDNITNTNTPSFGGTVPAGMIVRLFEGTTQLGVDTSTASGNYSLISSTLSDGVHQVFVRFEDPAGNQAASASPTLSVTIDTTPPAAPTVAPNLLAASDTGSSTTDNITRDNTPTFTGTLPDGFSVQLYEGFAHLGSSSGSTTYNLTVPLLSDGVHTIVARFTDVAGNQSTTSSPALSVTIDTASPTVTASSFQTLSVRFHLSEAVEPSLATSDLTLTNLTSAKAVDPAVMSLSYRAEVADFLFPGLTGGKLDEGSYEAALSLADVTDVAGNPLASHTPLRFIFSPGTGGADVFTVRRAAGGSTITVQRGAATFTADTATVSNIALEGGGGDDRLSIDLVNGNPVPLGALAFTGGNGADTVELLGTAAAETVSVGTAVQVGGRTISPTVERIVFDGRGGSDALSVTDRALALTGPQQLASLTLSGASAVVSAASGLTPLTVTTLNLNTGTLDLNDNDLITANTSLLTVNARVRAAYAGGAWNGAGITSSHARNDVSGLTGLAVVPFGGAGARVVYTWAADANADEEVDADDYFIVDRGFLARGGLFRDGDFDYSGLINLNDYALIDSVFLALG